MRGKPLPERTLWSSLRFPGRISLGVGQIPQMRVWDPPKSPGMRQGSWNARAQMRGKPLPERTLWSSLRFPGRISLGIVESPMRVWDPPKCLGLEIAPAFSQAGSVSRENEISLGPPNVRTWSPIPPRDRRPGVNAINKAEFIGLASQGQASTRTRRTG
jgi:hypothetical protein